MPPTSHSSHHMDHAGEIQRVGANGEVRDGRPCCPYNRNVVEPLTRLRALQVLWLVADRAAMAVVGVDVFGRIQGCRLPSHPPY